VSFGSAVLVTIGAWQGCSIYGPNLLLPAPADAGSESGPEAAAPVPCVPALPPQRPAADDASVAGTFSGVAAMQAIDVGYGFGTSEAGAPTITANSPLAPYGWNLDNTCTCQGSPPGGPSCSQAAGTKENCDDEAGRDHIALELFRVLTVTAETGSETANLAMHNGQYGLLIQITGYNGSMNDEQVTVALYASNGVAAPDGGTPAPKHNGNDNWTVDPGYVMGGLGLIGTNCDSNNPACMPQFADTDAYVTNGVMVANLGTVPLTFGSQPNIGGAVMLLHDVLLVGTLVQTGISGGDVGWGITNGSVSGRWETSELLSNLSTIPDPKYPGSYFCGADPVYPLFKAGICALQDIASDKSNDNSDPLAPCNALSMAFGFMAEPARLGAVMSVAPALAGCEDGGLPWHDTCP
jgi:hypothetical protein